jgi:peptide/nickel transport system ATP-binding protein
MTLLTVNNLSVSLDTAQGRAQAVRDLSFDLAPGGTLGIVGESGCGKTMSALAILGLLPDNAVTTGAIHFNDRELLSCTEAEWCDIRGNQIAMIFQEPMTSLNPVHRIGRQIMESMFLHRALNKAQALEETIRLLETVGIQNAAERVKHYPHQLSGGQRQRVMIAIALANQPRLLIADEPTTAVDVTIQKQILDLINKLIDEFDMGLVLISHDLGVIAKLVERVIVMYGGVAIESGSVETIFSDPAHPYTCGLLSAIPRIDRSVHNRHKRLPAIPGVVPDLVDMPAGCTFSDRCSLATDTCRTVPPTPVALSSHHQVACYHLDRARAQWQTDPR